MAHFNIMFQKMVFHF